MRIRFERPHQILLLAVLALVLLPIVGSFIRWGDFPPEFLHFPQSREGEPKPGPNYFYFGSACILAAVITAFLIVPTWFGFRRKQLRPRRPSKKRLPVWFWLGAVLNLVSWGLMWWGPAFLAKYSFVPLWWGFIVAIDGIVYARTGGRSLMSTEPKRMLIITAVSVPAWSLFEYLNYFALAFWTYPNKEIFSPIAQACWFLLSFTTVWPAIFEWYTLLHTSHRLWGRFSDGPKLRVSRRATGTVAVIGFAAMVLFAVFPFPLLVLLWVGPPFVLIAALSALGFWTPLRPIEDGNWSPLVLAALASLANGFFWELWNYGSRHFQPDYKLTNPNYWDYHIPYVEIGHPFSEMPFLGYFGYLPFGVLAWVCWLVAAHLLDVEPDFDLTPGVGGPPDSFTPDTSSPDSIVSTSA